MKVFSILFILIAIASIVFSATKINFNAPFEGDSLIALIMIMAALCALVLVLILMTSKKIQGKLNKKK